MHRIDELRYALLPIAIVVLGWSALILLEPDFGTSMSLLLIAAVMVFAAGLNYRYVVGALCALPPVHRRDGSAYRRAHAGVPQSLGDPLGDGFQIIQSLIAVGTGGVWGKG
jgi:cell division protein FtsW (lipid II flippase)